MTSISNMTNNEVIAKTKRATIWTFVTEIFAKLASPVSSIVLARLLAPEIFGIATAATIVTSFCETISEAGFSKYLIQHDFSSDDEYKKSISLSLISNFILSILLIAVIFIFRYQFSYLIGNTGYEAVLFISSFQIPFASLSSIFIAILRRKFEFKKLFFLRLINVISPFLITVPLAFIGFSYWSLVIGSLATSIIQFIVLILFSKFRIKLTFSFSLFKNMISASFIMLIESLVIWMCSWIVVFITSIYFNNYYVGIIKISNSTITSIFGIISGAITPVLFSSLSRLKDNDTFKIVFLKMTRLSAYFVVPMAIGCFAYSDYIVDIFLGSNWIDAGIAVAFFALSRPFLNSLSFHLSEVFRSKGHFSTSLLYQIILFSISLVLMLIGAQISFEWFVIFIAISNFVGSLVSFLFLTKKYHFSLAKLVNCFIPSFIFSLLFIPISLISKFYSFSKYQIIGQMLCCAIIYFVFAFLFDRYLINDIKKIFNKNNSTKEI